MTKTVEILTENENRIREAIASRPAPRGMDADDCHQIVAMQATRANAQTLGEVIGMVDATMAAK